ncbi:hypothetical protein V8F33_011751 [Rhypophila sp. PSN 637]
MNPVMTSSPLNSLHIYDGLIVEYKRGNLSKPGKGSSSRYFRPFTFFFYLHSAETHHYQHNLKKPKQSNHDCLYTVFHTRSPVFCFDTMGKKSKATDTMTKKRKCFGGIRGEKSLTVVFAIMGAFSLGEVIFGIFTGVMAEKRKVEAGHGKSLFTMVLSGLSLLVLLGTVVSGTVLRKRIFLVCSIIDGILSVFWSINFGVYAASYMEEDSGDPMRRRMWYNLVHVGFIIIVGLGQLIFWLKKRKELGSTETVTSEPEAQHSYALNSLAGGHQPAGHYGGPNSYYRPT